MIFAFFNGKNVMGILLHKFDLSLNNYVVDIIVQNLSTLEFARHFETEVNNQALLTYFHLLRDERFDSSVERRHLTDAEFEVIERVFENEGRDSYCRWEPYPQLHGRYIRTILEVRNGLSQQTAEEWSKDCSRFRTALEKENLSLRDGFVLVHEWIQRLRNLQLAMVAEECVAFADVPKSHGLPPTKCMQSGISDIDRMRKAIAKLGKEAKPAALIKAAGISNSNGRAALRSLENDGEFQGFHRPRTTNDQ
ncbi:MAG TPA: hypothetical protein VGM92_03950 [Candidatus Kapabacteria bacterium]